MNSTKVVINICYGGFGLSDRAKELYRELTGIKYDHCLRHDVNLVKVVESLGVDSYGKYAELHIEEIPSEFTNCYQISEYDGTERIDLSSYLLVDYKLGQADIENMELSECKAFLLELKLISATNYYD